MINNNNHDDGDRSSVTVPLLASASATEPPVEETVGVDEMLVRFAGEFGWWQLRNFLLTSLAWALNAFHTLVVIFADREPLGTDSPDSSTLSEWGLVGEERYKVGLARSAFFAGSMVGSGVFGSLSDSFLGRKGTLTVTCSLNAAFGFLTAFSPSFPFYVALRFLTGFSTGGVGLTAFVLTTEPVGPSKRGAVAMSVFYFFSLGTIVLAVVALFVSSWRSLYVATSVPSLLFVVSVLPFVSESPRWHLVHCDPSAAMRIVRSIAKANGRRVPEGVSLSLDLCNNQQDQSKHGGGGTSSILDVLRSPVVRTRLALAVAINLIISVVYYGLTLNVENLGTDLHAGVVLNAVAEMPAYALTAALVRGCGRRPLVVWLTWTCAAFCIVGGAVPDRAGGGAARTACGVVGISAMTATFNLLFIYTAELFPTAVRSAALGCVTQAGQMGAIVAPMVVVLGGNWPFAAFGVCATVGGLLGFSMPETLNRPMYDTMEGMENGEEEKKKKKEDVCVVVDMINEEEIKKVNKGEGEGEEDYVC